MHSLRNETKVPYTARYMINEGFGENFEKMNLSRNAEQFQLNQSKEKDNMQMLFERLSTPKSIKSQDSTPSWRLTESMKRFVPSLRLEQMAQPKQSLRSQSKFGKSRNVKKTALKYKASNRILELAKPTSHPEKKSRDPYTIPRKALKANVSERLAQLANPRNRTEPTFRKDPFKVSRKALTAKASKHILKLAQPKIVYSNDTSSVTTLFSGLNFK